MPNSYLKIDISRYEEIIAVELHVVQFVVKCSIHFSKFAVYFLLAVFKVD